MPTKILKIKGATVELPDYHATIRGGVKAFLPTAGAKLVARMRDKIGTYQPGWAPLAPSTIRRKARGLRKLRKARQSRMGWGPDTPLLDLGRMRNSTRFSLRASSVIVTMNSPIGYHEQDLDVSDIGPLQRMPARPVMMPALNELMTPLTRELEKSLEALL